MTTVDSLAVLVLVPARAEAEPTSSYNYCGAQGCSDRHLSSSFFLSNFKNYILCKISNMLYRLKDILFDFG